MGFKFDHKTEGVPPVTPVEAVKNGYLKIFAYSDCISRSEFWYFTGFFCLTAYSALFFAEGNIWETGNPLVNLIYGITGLSWFSAQVRRLHDIGKTGYWIFIALFGIGLLVLMWWWSRPGINPKENKYSNEFIDNEEKAAGHQDKAKNTQSVTEFTIEQAERLAEIINESLILANDSKNIDTKVTRLEHAKLRLHELEDHCQKHPYIKMPNLDAVKDTIKGLEHEFNMNKYSMLSESNLEGELLEKEGNIEEAISKYEELVSLKTDTPFTYRRLAIIYSKRKNFDDEKRIIISALENISRENEKHYQWFLDRKNKKSPNM